MDTIDGHPSWQTTHTLVSLGQTNFTEPDGLLSVVLSVAAFIDGLGKLCFSLAIALPPVVS